MRIEVDVTDRLLLERGGLFFAKGCLWNCSNACGWQRGSWRFLFYAGTQRGKRTTDGSVNRKMERFVDVGGIYG